MTDLTAPAPIELQQAAPPRARPALGPLLTVGLLVVLTVAAIRIGDGNIALALVPSLAAIVLLALWMAPLRLPMLSLLVMAWAIEAPGDVFADDKVKTPWKKVGEVLWGKLNEVIPFPPLIFTGLDFVVLLLFAIVAYRQLHKSTLDRTADWVDTPRPLGFFLWMSVATVGWMAFYGLARGGSFRFILWQSIRWLYLPIVYALMRQALRGPVDIRLVGKL